tara:strand:+ start:137 stop:619 length:483 start_codon:yes stop_codon:yes gene_type:complete
MVTFRNNNNNNNRRGGFRRNTRNFKSAGDTSKFGSNFSNNDNFKRKAPGRNNHNAAKLIEKYNDLAREALSNGDKILSENYLQHADHFQRVHNEKESFKRDKFSFDNSENNADSSKENSEISDQNSNSEISDQNPNKDLVNKSSDESKNQKSLKFQVEIN